MSEFPKKSPPSKGSQSMEEQIENEKPKKIVTKNDSFESFLETAEVIEFIKLQELTGSLAKPFDQFDLMEQKAFRSLFHQWTKAGKPKPKMPEIKAEQVDAPVCLFRRKQRGQEMTYWDTTSGKVEGRDADGKYTIPYTKELAEKLLDEQEKLNPPTQNTSCYIVLENKPVQIHTTDFLKDFDHLAEDVKNGNYIF